MRFVADLAGLRLRVFALYPLGAVSTGAPQTPPLRRYKGGAIFEGWWPTCFTREPHRGGARNRPDGRGRLELWKNAPHLASASQPKTREGYPGPGAFLEWTRKHKTDPKREWRSVCLYLKRAA